MPYTQGVWRVKPGRAAEFVAAWAEFADWTRSEAPGASWAKLLKDTADPNRFVSFGPWASLEAIDAWRALEGWKLRIGRIRELLDGVEVATLDLVSEKG